MALKEDLISIEEANGFSSTQQAQARVNIAAAATPGSWTRTVLTSGAGTYTSKAGCKALLVRLIGGGAGGGGGGSSGGTGGAGGATTFGSSFLTANGGLGGGGNGNASQLGGTATGGDININGGMSWASFGAGGASSVVQAGSGGNSVFGGAGAGGWPASPGGAGATNSGGGGGGGQWRERRYERRRWFRWKLLREADHLSSSILCLFRWHGRKWRDCRGRKQPFGWRCRRFRHHHH